MGKMLEIIPKILKTIAEKGPTAAEALATGTGLWMGCVPLFVFLLIEVMQIRLDQQSSEKLEDALRRLKQIQAGGALAADEIARLEEIPTDDLPPGDLRLLYLVFYRFLRGEFDAARLDQGELADALERLSDVQKRRWADLIFRELPAIQHSLALAHEDLETLLEGHRRLSRQLDKQNTEALGWLDASAAKVPLEFTLLVPDESMRFTYRGQWLPMVGRAQEMEELRAFLAPASADSVDFRWWIWTGPGGSGKSRLAWELCLEAEIQGWRVGFLDEGIPFHDWHRWIVDQPTLIVIDYVSMRASQARAAILGLTQHTENIRQPVRLLLLERSANPGLDPWWSEFDQPSTSAKHDQLRQFAYWPGNRKDRPRELSQFTRQLKSLPSEALQAIFSTVCDQKGVSPPDRWAVLEFLRDIDPQGRPLFAMFAAEALVVHGFEGLRKWNAATLVEKVLSREFDGWRRICGVADGPSQKFEQHLNLLTFVTICGAKSFEVADELSERGLDVPSGDRVNLRWWHSFLGYAAEPTRNQLMPLAPDILGEMYVLQRLRIDGTLNTALNPRLTPSRTTKALLAHAWASFPLETATFMMRAISDFRQDGSLPIQDLFPGAKSDLPPCLNCATPSEDAKKMATLLVSDASDNEFEGPYGKLAVLDGAVEEWPDFATAHNNRGATLHSLREFSEALAACDRAIALEPDMPEAHNNLGAALFDLGRPEEALTAYDRALELEPSLEDAHFGRGLCLEAIGDLPGAVDALRRAKETVDPATFLAYEIRTAIHRITQALDMNGGLKSDTPGKGTQCAVQRCRSSVGATPTRQLDRSSR